MPTAPGTPDPVSTAASESPALAYVALADSLAGASTWKLQFLFDQALSSGQSPSIELYISHAREQDRAKLLRKLITLDRMSGLRRGKPLPAQSYYQRFPAEARSIDDSFEDARTQMGFPKGTRYESRGHLGKGAFGDVYFVHDTKLERNVALKIPNVELRSQRSATQQLLTEARKQAQLDHPGIVGIYDVGPTDDDPALYISMEYIAGVPLAASVGKPMSFDKAVDILLRVTEAVDFAHMRKLIHSDLKPANILIDKDGVPHVADFGLARRVAQAESLPNNHTSNASASLAGLIDRSLPRHSLSVAGGTPAYMSPEQWTSGVADSRSDIWSLGVILFELLCGQLPFPGDSIEAIKAQVVGTNTVPSLQSRNPDIPSYLDRICGRCFAREVNDRYATAQELQEDLQWWLNRKRRARRRIVIATASILALSATGFAWQWQEYRKQFAADVASIDRSTEEGRQDILSGNAQRAFPILEKAYTLAAERDALSPRLQFLLARATAAMGSNVKTFGSKEDFLVDCRMSPDGNCLASIGENQRVTVWNVRSGERLLHLEPPAQPPSYAGFSPDSQRLLMVTGAEVEVWDINSKQRTFQAQGHTLDIKWVTFSPDGSHLATTSADNTARIWSFDGKTELTLEGNSRSVVHCTFDSTGERLVTASLDRTARLWDARNGQLLKTFQGSKGGVEYVSFSPDGRRLVTVSSWGDPQIRVWDTQSGEIQHSTDCAGLTLSTYPQFTTDGARCLVAGIRGNAHEVEVWDVLANQQIATLTGHNAMIAGADITPDGAYVATGSFDKTIRVWDLVSQQELFRLDDPFANIAQRVSFAMDGSKLITTGDAGVWVLRDLTKGALLASRSDEVLAASNEYVIAKNAPGVTALAPVILENDTRTFPDTMKAHCAAFSPDGKRFAFATEASGELFVGDVQSMRITSVPGYNVPTSSLHFDSTGERLIAIATRDFLKPGIVRLIDVAQGRILSTFNTNALQLLAAGFEHGTGEALIVQFGNTEQIDSQNVEIRRIADGSVLRSFPSPSTMLVSGAFSADGTRLVLCNADGGASVWDVASGTMIGSVSGHKSSFVNAAAFSPDASLVATGGNDRTVKVWDVASAKLLISFNAHTSPVKRVAWTPDGTKLVASCTDGTSKVWDVRLDVPPVAEQPLVAR
jgi:WD40 repeat protein/serine/threonine protein kinase